MIAFFHRIRFPSHSLFIAFAFHRPSHSLSIAFAFHRIRFLSHSLSIAFAFYRLAYHHIVRSSIRISSFAPSFAYRRGNRWFHTHSFIIHSHLIIHALVGTAGSQFCLSSWEPPVPRSRLPSWEPPVPHARLLPWEPPVPAGNRRFHTHYCYYPTPQSQEEKHKRILKTGLTTTPERRQTSN